MKKIILLLILTISSFFSNSTIRLSKNLKRLNMPFYYDNSGRFDPERLIFGGNLGMNFLDKGYQFFVAPTIGYVFGNRFQLGTNISFLYHNEDISFVNSTETYHYVAANYSGSIFLRLFFLRYLFLQAEPEMNFIKTFEYPSFTQNPITQAIEENTVRKNIPAFNIGAGFILPINQRFAFVLYGLYDVAQHPLSPYNKKPIIRGGFNMGFFR